MERVSTLFRHCATAALLLAGIASATFLLDMHGRTASAASSRGDGAHIGFLAVGSPNLEKRSACLLCTRVREQASDYAPVQHFLGGPKRIILLRHADKTDDSDDPDLSDAGRARADHLATYIPQTFGKPDFIFATAHSKHSNRPRETVQPLADALGLKVEHDMEKDEFEDLVDEVFNDPDYKGKTLVICWHHGTLPAIAALLGAPAGSYPDPWPDDAYNLVLDLQYDPNSGSAPTVSRVIEPF
ncbi:histidine phosphatase family protein [Hyphomicrobium sp. 99]|uniref:histidine phosphatase family protein n=1 Tax=Hyphomicrobium sp. 99 TaxID=1163419 RepID=UPI00069776B1|nr:histidine phosphatase family protein [Hyphomicrobium sp. 99]